MRFSLAIIGVVIYYRDMKNDKMYLTKNEADAKGIPSTQEQIDRYNRAIEVMRNTRPDSPMYLDSLAEVRAIREAK